MESSPCLQFHCCWPCLQSEWSSYNTLFISGSMNKPTSFKFCPKPWPPEHTSPFRMLTLKILWWTFYFNQYTCRRMDVHTLFHMVLSWHTYLPIPTHYICESTEIKLWHPGHNFKSCYVLSKTIMFSWHYEPEVFKRVCLMNVVSSHLCQPLKIGFPWQLTPIGSLMLLRSHWDEHSAEIHCRATSFICGCSPDPCACTEGKTLVNRPAPSTIFSVFTF